MSDGRSEVFVCLSQVRCAGAGRAAVGSRGRGGAAVSLLPPAGRGRALQHHHRVPRARALLLRLEALRARARARSAGMRVPGALRIEQDSHTQGPRV